MKKKLDELKRTFPQPDSPIPSPDVNAPSPGNTPPHLGSATYNYNPSAPEGNFKSGVIDKLARFLLTALNLRRKSAMTPRKRKTALNYTNSSYM